MNCMNIRRILGRDVGNLHDIILTDNYVAVKWYYKVFGFAILKFNVSNAK